MLNQIIKVAGIGLATTIGLAVTANNAQAFDFSFNNFDVDGNTINGTFSIDDSAINPGTTTSLTFNDFNDWEITSVGSGGTFTMYGPGGTFGTHNSSFWTNGSFAQTNYPGVFSTDGSTLTMSNFLIADNITGDVAGDNRFGGSNVGTRDNNYSMINGTELAISPQIPVVSTAVSPTPVPFGVSTDLSLMILGGMYGASRLRKKLAAKKS